MVRQEAQNLSLSTIEIRFKKRYPTKEGLTSEKLSDLIRECKRDAGLNGLSAADLIEYEGIKQPLIHLALRLDNKELIHEVASLPGFYWGIENISNKETCFHAIAGMKLANPKRLREFYEASQLKSLSLLIRKNVNDDAFWHVLLSNPDAREKDIKEVLIFFMEKIQIEEQDEFIDDILSPKNRTGKNILTISAARGFEDITQYLLGVISKFSLEKPFSFLKKNLYPNSNIANSPVFAASSAILPYTLEVLIRNGALQILPQSEKNSFPKNISPTVIASEMAMGWDMHPVLQEIDKSKLPYAYWVTLYMISLDNSSDFFERRKLATVIKALLPKSERKFRFTPYFLSMISSEIEEERIKRDIKKTISCLQRWEVYLSDSKNLHNTALTAAKRKILPLALLVILVSIGIFIYYDVILVRGNHILNDSASLAWDELNAECGYYNGTLHYKYQNGYSFDLCRDGMSHNSASKEFLSACCKGDQTCANTLYPDCIATQEMFHEFMHNRVTMIPMNIASLLIFFILLGIILDVCFSMHSFPASPVYKTEAKKNITSFAERMRGLYEQFKELELVSNDEYKRTIALLTDKVTEEHLLSIIHAALRLLKRHELEPYSYIKPVDLQPDFPEPRVSVSVRRTLVYRWHASRRLPGYGAIPIQDAPADDANSVRSRTSSVYYDAVTGEDETASLLRVPHYMV